MSFLLRAVAALALVLSLFSPAFAGTVTLTPGQNSITLDTPPPGATSIRVRATAVSADLTHGYENLDITNFPTFDTSAQWGFVLKDGANEVCTDRILATVQTNVVLAYDGTLDYGGVGGVTFTETKTKGVGPWTTYAGLPATLTAQTRTSTPAQPPNISHLRTCSRTITYEWEWI